MCHVLIIEDEALIAMYIEALLEAEGVTSFSFATTEAEALEAALQSHPTLITSDVKLLAGRGPAAVEQITAELGTIPVIFITGSPDACVPASPAAVVLTKPLKPTALVEAFHRLVDTPT